MLDLALLAALVLSLSLPALQRLRVGVPSKAQRVLWVTMVQHRARSLWRQLNGRGVPAPTATSSWHTGTNARTTLGKSPYLDPNTPLPTTPSRPRTPRGVWVGNVYRIQRRSTQMFPG